MTAREFRKRFWADNPNLNRKIIRHYSGRGWMYCTDTRCAFVDYVDSQCRAGVISQQFANHITLEG